MSLIDNAIEAYLFGNDDLVEEYVAEMTDELSDLFIHYDTVREEGAQYDDTTT